MDKDLKHRRAYGSGGLIQTKGVWYAKWRIGDRQVKRRLGPVRKPATKEGLTKPQAEAALRRMMLAVTAPPVIERVTVEEAGNRLLTHLETMGRKPSTIRTYRSNLRLQIVPRVGALPVSRLSRTDVEELVSECIRGGLAPKTTGHVVGLLSTIYEYAIRNGWVSTNPCRGVDRPTPHLNLDLRFLDPAEVEALLMATPDTDFGKVQRVLYLAAVMSGLRQGELLALRWHDIDWSAQRIRVRRNIVRGQYGTPKSNHGRSVPLADRLGGELDQLQQSSAYGGDNDLVFGNPDSGRPMNAHSLLKAFQRHLAAAGVRRIRFHDLRHTFGTRMAAAGVPMRTVQEWMGHQDHSTTLIYAHYAPGEREVELLNTAFSGSSWVGPPGVSTALPGTLPVMTHAAS